MNTKYWTAFASIEQLDSTFIQRLYNYFGDIETAYNATLNDLKQIEGLSIRKAENFIEKKKNVNPDKTLEEIEKRNIKILTFDNPKYPYMLSEISNPPMTIFYKGDLFSCNLQRTVAFVGSRRASLNGKESVRKIVHDFKNTDICIVSGLAEGIDTISHKSAIENNLKTIGVIASGFDFIYPKSNRNLYELMENGAGAIVSEYYPTFEPLKFRFPQRNRIVTGLSYGTVVGEAAIKSGALISANLTLEQGRELMCIPGQISNPNTEGIYKLLKNGAALVTTTQDILDTMGWTFTHQSDCEPEQKSFMDDIEKEIYDIVALEDIDVDGIMSKLNIEYAELITILTGMELNGILKQTDGGKFTVC